MIGVSGHSVSETQYEFGMSVLGRASLRQAIYLRNDPDIHRFLNRENGWISQSAKKQLPVSTLIREAYLRCLCREPTDRDMSIAVDYVEQSPSLRDGLRALVWSLVNSKEFRLNF